MTDSATPAWADQVKKIVSDRAFTLNYDVGMQCRFMPVKSEQGAHTIEILMETAEDLFAERDAEEKVWGSMVKQAIKRRKPGFNESYYGFKSFGKLLEEARDRKLIDLEFDAKSGGYIIARASNG